MTGGDALTIAEQRAIRDQHSKKARLESGELARVKQALAALIGDNASNGRARKLN
jgi:hypothetical protein